MPHWGDFQSLIQLSTGLNTALAALSDFFGAASRDETTRARRFINEVKKMRMADKDAGNGPTYNEIEANLIISEGRAKSINENYSRFIHKRIRPACIFVSFGTIILLIVSSYFYDKDINLTFQCLVILSMTPFVAGLLKVILLSAQAGGVSKEIEDLYAIMLHIERSKYENEMES